MYSLSRRCLSSMHSFSVTPADIAISHTLLETIDSLGYIFVMDIIGLFSTTVT